MSDALNHCSCGARAAPTRLFEVVSRTSLARSTLLRCAGCGSLYPEALPMPPEAEREYDTGSTRRSRVRRLARHIVDLTRRRYVERATPAAARRVLDFGCGAGDYLETIVAAGRQSFGVDLIRPARAANTWRWIAGQDMEHCGPFDWITLGHVLEHLDEPAPMLSRLTGLLAPGGGLWIATPNARSFIFDVAEAAARDVDYPRHREVFSRHGLEQRLNASGLDATFVSPPRVNAILNVATTARQIGPGRIIRSARLWLALVAHLLKSRPARDAESPELIVVCRIRSAARSPAR